MSKQTQNEYWTNRYKEGLTGWDIGYLSTPIKTYIDQLTDNNIKILIPGAGNAYEAEYLHQQGFVNVFVLDVSEEPLKAFKQRMPDFPDEHLLHDDFFSINNMSFDLILEQTFFCSFEPNEYNRSRYASQMNNLLKEDGRLVGLWFNHPLHDDAKRPFGGSKIEYLSYLEPYFVVQVFESCYNSIPARKGAELFGIFQKRSN